MIERLAVSLSRLHSGVVEVEPDVEEVLPSKRETSSRAASRFQAFSVVCARTCFPFVCNVHAQMLFCLQCAFYLFALFILIFFALSILFCLLCAFYYVCSVHFILFAVNCFLFAVHCFCLQYLFCLYTVQIMLYYSFVKYIQKHKKQKSEHIFMGQCKKYQKVYTLK